MFQGSELVPKQMFFTTGFGLHREKLTSFEMALRDAGIAQHNLVRVSSIFPPGCEIIDRAEGARLLRPGQVVFCVLSEAASNEPSRRVAASIGLAQPADGTRYGYISEHHSFGQSERVAGDYAEDLAATMLATTLGVAFDPAEAWDERREQWLMEGQIVNTQNHTIVAETPEDGRWATVIASAVICG